MRYIAFMTCILSALSAIASDQTKLNHAVQHAVEQLEAVNLVVLPVRYVTGKALEEYRQRALKAAARVSHEQVLLRGRDSLEVEFLLASDMRSLYDNMNDLSEGLSLQTIEQETLAKQASGWMLAITQAAGPVSEVTLDLEGELQHDLRAADGRLRKCK